MGWRLEKKIQLEKKGHMKSIPYNGFRGPRVSVENSRTAGEKEVCSWLHRKSSTCEYGLCPRGSRSLVAGRSGSVAAPRTPAAVEPGGEQVRSEEQEAESTCGRKGTD